MGVETGAGMSSRIGELSLQILSIAFVVTVTLGAVLILRLDHGLLSPVRQLAMSVGRSLLEPFVHKIGG
jgi:hypothetical protein